jgi:hypothetical protein
MFRLIYVSTARELMDKDALLGILAKAREKNARLGITGMLLYKDGNFLQLLEGEESLVRDVYATIARDTRHFDSMIMMEEEVSERVFADWKMGFHDLSDPALQSLPGFAPFRHLNFDQRGAAPDVAICLDILKFFKDSR